MERKAVYISLVLKAHHQSQTESNVCFPCSVTRVEGKSLYFPHAKACNPMGTETMEYIFPSLYQNVHE